MALVTRRPSSVVRSDSLCADLPRRRRFRRQLALVVGGSAELVAAAPGPGSDAPRPAALWDAGTTIDVHVLRVARGVPDRRNRYQVVVRALGVPHSADSRGCPRPRKWLATGGSRAPIATGCELDCRLSPLVLHRISLRRRRSICRCRGAGPHQPRTRSACFAGAAIRSCIRRLRQDSLCGLKSRPIRKSSLLP